MILIFDNNEGRRKNLAGKLEVLKVDHYPYVTGDRDINGDWEMICQHFKKLIYQKNYQFLFIHSSNSRYRESAQLFLDTYKVSSVIFYSGAGSNVTLEEEYTDRYVSFRGQVSNDGTADWHLDKFTKAINNPNLNPLHELIGYDPELEKLLAPFQDRLPLISEGDGSILEKEKEELFKYLGLENTAKK